MENIDLSEFSNKKVALVLSGGIVKAAAWHIGVIRALENMGFTLKHNRSPKNPEYEISTYVGSSAGSLISVLLAAGYSAHDIIESNINRNKGGKLKPITYKHIFCFKKYKRGKVNYESIVDFPFIIRNLAKPFLSINGFFSTRKFHDYIKKELKLPVDFNDYEADLFIVSTQLDHSRKSIFGKYDYPNIHRDSTTIYYTGINVPDSVAASMSVPPFYSPYPVENIKSKRTEYYIDGEIRETLSSHVATDNRCDYAISSWTHTPYHYIDEIGSLVNYGLPAICTQAIYLMIQKKIISSRAKQDTAKDILNVVNDYMKHHNFENRHRIKLLAILEKKLNYDPNVHFIDIYPKPNEYNVFFHNSFTLNPQKNLELIRLAYQRTIEIFTNKEWNN